MAFGLFFPKNERFGGMFFFSFFWAQDFCKKIDLNGGFFFRVSVFHFVTIYRQTIFYESIMVTLFFDIARIFCSIYRHKIAEKC